MTFQDRNYVNEALELIKEQKGIQKLKYSKALKSKDPKKLKAAILQGSPNKEAEDTSNNSLNYCEGCQYSKTIQHHSPAIFMTSKSNVNPTDSPSLSGIKKREEKKDQVLICGYCSGAFHLSCIITDPKWNRDLRPKTNLQNLDSLSSSKTDLKLKSKD